MLPAPYLLTKGSLVTTIAWLQNQLDSHVLIITEGFKQAYTEMAKKHPCFGFSEKIPNSIWWKTCVRDSFIRVREIQTVQDMIMTKKHLTRFSDAYMPHLAPRHHILFSPPFLRWLREKDIIVGIVSNAEYRYQDVILPALGLHQGSEWDFGVFSGLEGVEKPDPRLYEIALERAGNIAPEQALHVGDSMRKDYLPAKSVGMHGLLLDRFKTPDAENWRKSGAVVLPDLVAAQQWLTSAQQSVS